MIDLKKPLKNRELNRKRNILTALENLFCQIDEVQTEYESSLVVEMTILWTKYLADLKRANREKRR